MTKTGDHVQATIWTDDHNSFQARCARCTWRGPWRETGRIADREGKAVADAQAHIAECEES